jgi:hypothetical protein
MTLSGGSFHGNIVLAEDMSVISVGYSWACQIATFAPASAGLSSASTGQNRQHNCFPSACKFSTSKRLLWIHSR